MQVKHHKEIHGVQNDDCMTSNAQKTAARH